MFEIFFSLILIFLNIEENEACNYGTVSNGASCVACGKVFFNENVRIVGGVPAIQGSWPASVLISINSIGSFQKSGLTLEATQSFTCAGTLLDAYTILTAAHCILTEFYTIYDYEYIKATVKNPFESSQYTVYVGVYNNSFLNNGDKPKSPAVKMAVETVIRHPNFDNTDILNDIAILKLSQPVDFNNFVQPACLPSPSFGLYYPNSKTNFTVYVGGWGQLYYDGPLPDVFYNVQINIYPALYCSLSGLYNESSQICAGRYEGGKDSCYGDSGGALYIYDSNLSKYTAVGIVSKGAGCAVPGSPGVYTRVSYFYSWIYSYMEKNINSNAGMISTDTFLLAFTLYKTLNLVF